MIAQSNYYHPFPVSNALWRENGGCAQYQNFITNDTIFNGKTYYKLQSSGIQYATNQYNGCEFNVILWYFNFYYGAYRNDSINRKVYYLPANATKDTLLYDFNLHLLDTLPQTCLYNSVNGVSFVTGIDSIFIGNDYHKRFQISSANGATNYVDLIEGIGSTYGILGNLKVPFESGSFLLCFKQNGYTVYPDTSYQWCDLVAAIDTKVINDLSFSIFPNPIQEVGKVNFNSSHRNVDLIINDILGVERLRINNLENKSVVNFSSLKSGIYLYQVEQDKKIQSFGKIMKAK